MNLNAACTELTYAKDGTPASKEWYAAYLSAFVAWASEQGVTDLEELTAPLVRRYTEHLRTRPSLKTGKPLDSFTVHGHIWAVRALLFWAAAQDLIDERIPRRIGLPKREQKVLAVFSADQIRLLFREAARTGAKALAPSVRYLPKYRCVNVAMVATPPVC